MDSLIIFTATYVIAVSVLITTYALYATQKEHLIRNAFILFASLALTYVLAKISSHFYFDARPFVEGGFVPLIPHAADNGFPSDHTLLAAALAAGVYLFNTRMSAVLWVIALLIGMSRVAAGVHHPIDIVGSIGIALLVGIAVFVAKQWYLDRQIDSDRVSDVGTIGSDA